MRTDTGTQEALSSASGRSCTGSREYGAVVAELVEGRNEPSRVAKLIERSGDGGDEWLVEARRELRQALVQGRLEDAEVLGEVIGALLRAREGGANDELAENRIHDESLQEVVRGISDVLDRDPLSGVAQLEKLTQALYYDESFRWVAWLWISRAAAETGDLTRSLNAAQEALKLAGRLDAEAHNASLFYAAEADFMAGNHAQALAHLDVIIDGIGKDGEPRTTARAWLTRAKIQADNGQGDQAAASAMRAREIDPEAKGPTLFMVDQALLRGDAATARELIEPLVSGESHSPEVLKVLRLIEMSEAGRVAPPTLEAFLRLRERPPSEEAVSELQRLVESHSDFLQLRELLAWNLVQVGQEELASSHFEIIVTRAMEPELQRSALLGLGCLANRRNAHSQPGRWLRSATSTPSAGGVQWEGVSPSRESLDSVPGADDLDVAMELLTEAEPPPPPVGADGALGVLQSDGDTGRAESKGSATRDRSQKRATVEQPAETSGSSSRVAFTGQLEMLAVPDLLEFLKASRRTGTLVLTSDAGIGAIRLRNGLATSAASPKCTSIGAILLAQGLVSEDQLAQAAAVQESEDTDQLMGAVLVQKGWVEEAAVRRALRDQILSAVVEMVQWMSGDFAFEPDRQQLGQTAKIDIELDTQGLLLDALRIVDEENRDD